MIESQILERQRAQADEYDRIAAVSRPRAEPHRARHFFGDVVRALQLQRARACNLKTLPTEGPQVLQGPGENAGAVDIGGGLAAVFKIESHNHPSFIEPYQGAATRCRRDHPRPSSRWRATDRTSQLAALRTARGARHTPAARRRRRGHCRLREQHRHPDRRRRNPSSSRPTPATRSSTCFASASAKASDIIKGVASGVGNAVYYVGAKTGRDGIHGATMASAEFDEKIGGEASCPCRSAIRSWRSCCSRRASR